MKIGRITFESLSEAVLASSCGIFLGVFTYGLSRGNYSLALMSGACSFYSGLLAYEIKRHERDLESELENDIKTKI